MEQVLQLSARQQGEEDFESGYSDARSERTDEIDDVVSGKAMADPHASSAREQGESLVIPVLFPVLKGTWSDSE